MAVVVTVVPVTEARVPVRAVASLVRVVPVLALELLA